MQRVCRWFTTLMFRCRHLSSWMIAADHCPEKIFFSLVLWKIEWRSLLFAPHDDGGYGYGVDVNLTLGIRPLFFSSWWLLWTSPRSVFRLALFREYMIYILSMHNTKIIIIIIILFVCLSVCLSRDFIVSAPWWWMVALLFIKRIVRHCSSNVSWSWIWSTRKIVFYSSGACDRSPLSMIINRRTLTGVAVLLANQQVPVKGGRYFLDRLVHQQ